MLKNKSCLIFDLDGTLIDSLHDVTICMNAALVDVGFDPLTETQIQQLVGPDLEYGISSVINDERFSFDTFIASYVAHYNQRSVENTNLYEGVKETITQLSEEGLTCVVLTNKPSVQATHILKHLKMDHFFDVIIGPDTYDVAKPDPTGIFAIQRMYDYELDEMVMIGDTISDVKAGQNAGVDTIVVSYGYGNRDDIIALSPTVIIDTFSELLSICLPKKGVG